MHLIRQLFARKPTNLRYIVRHVSTTVCRASATAEPLPVPPATGTEAPPNPKLLNIVNQIAELNLLEVSELSALLKKTLNLPDAPAVAYATGPAAAPAAAFDEEAAAPIHIQTEFTVKLLSFKEDQKVTLIKEVKNQLEGINLVQAKKIIEGAPAIFKEKLSKDDADKLKEALEKAGATVEIK